MSAENAFQNFTEIQKSKLFLISFPTLCLISLMLIAMSFIPQTRELIRNVIISESRTILAKAEATLPTGGGKLAVIKVKTADSLAIEIFESEPEGKGVTFVKRMVLPEIRDAYFNFHDQTTNLAISDLDGDGNLEILAPTFDENLVPRLNVYRYDVQRKDLIRLGPENFNL